MNILLLRNTNPFFENGASASRFKGLISGLRKSGHLIDIAVVDGLLSKKECSTENDGCIYLSRANRYSYLQSRINLYLLGWFYRKIIAYRFCKLNLAKYDYIWISKSENVLTLFCNEYERIPCKVFMELNEFNDVYLSHRLNRLQLSKEEKINKLFLEAVNKVDCFGIMTNALLEHFKKLAKPEAKFLHLPMTVDMSRFENVQREERYGNPYIAFTGCLDRQKDGVDILIEAFVKVADKYPSLDLVLAGFTTYDTPDILKLVSEHHLDNRIKYIGTLKGDEIPSFVCNAKVLALSRPDSHQARGGFPTKLGEYLASGNPVCVTRVGEIPNYLEDNVSAFISSPGDVDSFADALDRALRDSEKANEVGRNGRRIAERYFCVDLQTERLVAFLTSGIE